MIEDQWEDLEVTFDAEIIDQLTRRLKFARPTLVQRKAIPLIVQGKDVAVESCTGSGKTLAFVIPALQALLSQKLSADDPCLFCLIIAPTRELALQLRRVICEFCVEGKLAQIIVGLVCGGRKALGVRENDRPEDKADAVEKALRGHILVATPGRLAEILALDRGTSARQFKRLELLVLDEADRFLLDELPTQLSIIHDCLPKRHQTALFSATLRSLSPREWIALGLRDAIRLTLRAPAPNNAELPPQLVLYSCVFPTRLAKLDYLLQNLSVEGKSILFVNTCHAVDFYCKLLQALFPQLICQRLHGKMKQCGRERALARFCISESGLLVTTDVAARGLDVPHVARIFVLDVPQRPSELVHRVGRTARGDQPGTAFVLLLESERALLDHFAQQNVLFCEDRTQPQPQFWEGCRRVMPQDRDFFYKARKAMVSFLRSYCEHELKESLRADDLDVEDVALSFGLPVVPRLAEASVCQTRVLDADFLAVMRAAPFRDAHQAEQLEQRRKAVQFKHTERETRRKKAEREARTPKKRSFSNRKHAKERASTRDSAEANYEERLAKRVKRGTLSQAEFDRLVDRLNARYEP